jgi:hypothetical protein
VCCRGGLPSLDMCPEHRYSITDWSKGMIQAEARRLLAQSLQNVVRGHHEETKDLLDFLSMVEEMVTVIRGEESGVGGESAGDDSSVLELDVQFRPAYSAQRWVRDIGEKDWSKSLEESDRLGSFACEIALGLGQYEVTQGKGNRTVYAG